MVKIFFWALTVVLASTFLIFRFFLTFWRSFWAKIWSLQIRKNHWGSEYIFLHSFPSFRWSCKASMLGMASQFSYMSINAFERDLAVKNPALATTWAFQIFSPKTIPAWGISSLSSKAKCLFCKLKKKRNLVKIVKIIEIFKNCEST